MLIVWIMFVSLCCFMIDLKKRVEAIEKAQPTRSI